MKLFGGRKQEEQPRRRASSTRLEEESFKFRRSATLTGSLSDDVRASAEERGHLQSDRVEAQAKRKRQRRRSHRVGMAILLLFVVLLAFLNHASSFDIAFGNNPKRLPMTTPYVISAKEFASSSFGNQFIPTMNTAKLAAYITGHHKEIASVQVQRRLFSTAPRLTLTLRKPVLMWQTKNEATAFYVDATGTAFSFNAYGNDAELVRVNDESGVPTELGVPVASSRQISFLGQLVGQINQSSKGSLLINKIVFPSSSTKEIDVYLKDKKYYVKVYLERSARAQGEEIVKGVDYLNTKKITPAEYIDVRIAERIYYK